MSRAQGDFRRVSFDRWQGKPGDEIGQFRIFNGAVDPSKSFFISVNQLFQPLTRAMDNSPHGKSINKFIGKKDADRLFLPERFQVLKPAHVGNEIRVGSTFLMHAQGAGTLDDGVANRLEKIGSFRATPLQDVAGELAVVRPLFDHPERIGLFQRLPHLKKLTRQKVTKKWSNADAGKKISVSADGGGAVDLRVVTGTGMIKRQFHEAIKPHGPGGADFILDQCLKVCHVVKSYREFQSFTQPNLFYGGNVTNEGSPKNNPPDSLLPQEGLAALHLFYRVELNAWRAKSNEERTGALKYLEDIIASARQLDRTQVLTFSMLARADIGFMIITPDLHELNTLEKKITASLGPDVLVPEFTYLSMTEKSEYTQSDEDYALELEKSEGIPRGSAESEAKLIAFRERIQHYRHDRLYPVLPDWEYFCFYPMSKRREPGQNWYALDFEKRRELMGGHMRVGRTYAGRVRQLITGSTGLDDWEWGVSLFAHNPYDIKAIVYEMRFDEVTHTYGEFGPFYNGLPLPLKEIYRRVLLA
jgi:peroxiredoxin